MLPILDGRPLLRTLLLAVACGMLGLVVAGWYFPFLADDALISLRYSERLVNGLGLTWNDDYRVEGYSNLSWVLALAGLLELGADPVAAARWLGLALVLSVVATVVAVAARSEAWLPMGALAVLAVGTHLMWIWGMAGLEGPLVFACAFFGLLALDLWWRSARMRTGWLWAASGLFAVLAITRPDAPLLIAVAALLPLAGSGPTGERVRNAAILVSLPVLAFAAQMGFRLVYYGDWVPNTARVKVGVSEHRLSVGTGYVAAGVLNMVPVVLAVAVLMAWGPRRRAAPFWVGIAMAAAWFAYVAAVGGDNFPSYRHHLPGLGILLAVLLVARDAGPVRALDVRMRRHLLTALAAVAVAVVGMQAAQLFDARNTRAKTAGWVWDCKDLAGSLKDTFGASDPVIAVTAAGCFPFWTGFEALDLLGLNDLELPRRKPEDFGTGWIGHELGDLDYLLERKPDIVIFHIGGEPMFRYREQVARDDRFDAAYCAVPFPNGWEGLRIYLHRDYKAEQGYEAACLDGAG